MIDKHQRHLVASALTGGLARMRGRSSPERLATEARDFVGLLELALATPGKLGAAIAREVRVGALAGATGAEVIPVCGLWRRALDSLAMAANIGAARKIVIETLDAICDRLVVEANRWQRERVHVMVIGASAGGIAALTEILSALDTNLPMTLLVVIHVSPRLPSLLPLVLSRRSRLPIATAVEGATLYYGYVYVAPPGRHLVLSGGLLHLVDGPPVHFVKPSVDVLLESAAGIYGAGMASMILSGSGADGATGTRVVHEHRGVTFAQDPETAQFRGMPDAALATGAVDHSVPLGSLAAMIERLGSMGRSALEQRAD